MGVVVWDAVPVQLALVLIAFALTSLVGLERRLRRKSAGLRTHALVGTGSAVFTLVSAYGFGALPGIDAGPDPSRVAAQIITGIGFLGAGVIFTNRDVVHGLTTAASIWLSAAIGMACGAGLVPLAVVATGLHFVSALVLTPLSRRLPGMVAPQGLRLRYEDGHGVLREVLTVVDELQLSASVVSSRTVEGAEGAEVELLLRLDGKTDLRTAAVQLSKVAGVRDVAQQRLEQEAGD
ncbi:MgtC/SapB family protein [Kocuria sp. CPCC 205292]|uniref:MgtC/SapB family protein n=1 Tax=Kocuria cellulosilytica TaxID=3071451 RepID=UPI0034D6C21C